MGAERAVDPLADSLLEAVLDWTDGRGVDVVIELVGTGHAGRHHSVPGNPGPDGHHRVPHRTHVRDRSASHHAPRLTVMGSRNCSKQDLRDVVELVESGKVKPIYSETYPLEEAESVLERMAKGEYVGRPVLIP